MDEQNLQKQLHEIAQEEIGEDMNLWPAIRAQLDDSKARRMKFPFYLGRVASLLVALILFSTAGYAFYLNQLGGSGGDPGLIGVSEAELITPLNLTQTINEINVTLVWGYADGNRISFAYEVEYPDTLRPPGLSSIILKEGEDNILPGATYLGGGGGGGGGGEGRLMYGSTVSFDTTNLTNVPDSIKLTVDMTFDGAPDDPFFPSLGVPNENGNGQTGTSGGSGGSGGGGGSNAEPEPSAEHVPPFDVTFEFSLPFIPAIDIQTPQSLTSNDVSVEILSASIAPSVSLVELCYALPNVNGENWHPRFVIGEKIVSSGNFEPNMSTNDADAARICGQAVITDLFLVEGDRLSLRIDRFQTDPVMSLDRIQDFITAAQDMGVKATFDIHIDGESVSMGFSSVSDPQSSDDYATINLLYDDYLRDKIEGDWTFTFDVP